MRPIGTERLLEMSAEGWHGVKQSQRAVGVGSDIRVVPPAGWYVIRLSLPLSVHPSPKSTPCVIGTRHDRQAGPIIEALNEERQNERGPEDAGAYGGSAGGLIFGAAMGDDGHASDARK